MPIAANTTAPNYADMADAALVACVQAGQCEAFRTITQRCNQRMFRVVRGVIRDESEAEDVVQEAYLHAWRALDSFRADARLSTWLVRIVANEAFGRLRRKHAPVIPLDAAMISPEPAIQAALTDAPDHRPDNTAMRAELRRLLESRIDRLPDAFRTVFMLRAVQELSVEEVAQALAIPEATVRTRFFRARSLLREGLASQIDTTLGDVFAFDGARCDRIVAGVLAKGAAKGLSHKGD